MNDGLLAGALHWHGFCDGERDGQRTRARLGTHRRLNCERGLLAGLRIVRLRKGLHASNDLCYFDDHIDRRVLARMHTHTVAPCQHALQFSPPVPIRSGCRKHAIISESCTSQAGDEVPRSGE